MNEYILSIITVTKNCAATIKQLLQTIESIKCSDIEYLVIDGASTDSTLDVIRAHANLIDQLVSEPDGGIYNAMNKGVSLAKGRYVLFINADDELVPDGFPAIMLALAQGHDEIICATTLVGTISSPSETLVAKSWCLPFYNSVPHPSSFVARELLLRNPFREDLRIASDYDFFLNSYLSGKFFRILPIITALHQRGGASSDLIRSQLELEQVRSERLRWRYHIFNGLAGVYKFLKMLLRNVK